MKNAALMIQGTGSDVGKSIIVAGLCRVARQRGISVAPFKPQNMSNNAAACPSGGEIGRAQALQAQAAGVELSVDLNPVLLKPQTDQVAQVVVHGKAVSNLAAKDYIVQRQSLLTPVMQSFQKLSHHYDLVLVEGAGSASETNLRARDIANMGFATVAKVPVCLLADIERGGVIASLVGTRAVLEKTDADLVKSFIVNKFRGDITLFDDGRLDIERRTSWPCRGVIPWLKSVRRLPSEDSVATERLAAQLPQQGCRQLKIVVPMLSRIANSDDFDPLRLEQNVDMIFVPPGRPIPRDADVIILPGTKSTLGDLKFIREQGWDHDIISHARTGGVVIGLCGGYQILGTKIRDLHGVEGPPEEASGLGLLDVETDMLTQKTVHTLDGECLDNGQPVVGYEIHMGETIGADTRRRYIRFDDKKDGAINMSGNVIGCYVHGLFWSDAFRTAWLNDLRQGTASNLRYRQSVDSALDELAVELENALDIDALLRDANWH